MKNAIRKWLGVSNLEDVVLNHANQIEAKLGALGLNTYEIFHALPFVSGTMLLTAADAAKLTMPEGVTENSLPALLTGIIAQARQGRSAMQIQGTLPDAVRASLVKRGFKVEDQEGSGGKATFVLWT